MSRFTSAVLSYFLVSCLAPPALASVISDTDASIVVSGGTTAFTMWHVDGSHPCAVMITSSADRVEMDRTPHGGGSDDGPSAQPPAYSEPAELPLPTDLPPSLVIDQPSASTPSPVPLPSGLPLMAAALLALGVLGTLTRVGSLSTEEF